MSNDLFVDQAKKDLKKKEDSYNKLSSEMKSTKHNLSVQEKITNSSESSNKKYLSALMESQGFLKGMVNTVSDALGDMADIKLEKEEGTSSVKDEKSGK